MSDCVILYLISNAMKLATSKTDSFAYHYHSSFEFRSLILYDLFTMTFQDLKKEKYLVLFEYDEISFIHLIS